MTPELYVICVGQRVVIRVPDGRLLTSVGFGPLSDLLTLSGGDVVDPVSWYPQKKAPRELWSLQ